MSRALIALLFVTGCAENLIQAKVAVPTFEAKGETTTVSRAKVAVAVSPIGYAELEAGKVPRIKASWQEVDRSQVSSGSRMATKTRYGELQLIPLPSFAIAIVNESGAAITFKNATVSLEGKSGKKFAAILKPEDVAARVDVLTRERYPSAAEQSSLVDQMREAVIRLPLLSGETVIAAGQRFDGMLIIDFASFDLAELDRALATDREFVLTLDNLGGDSAPLAIKIPLDKTAVTITARCPEGKPATAQTCKAGVD